MFKKKFALIFVLIAVASALLLSSCGSDKGTYDNALGEEIYESGEGKNDTAVGTTGTAAELNPNGKIIRNVNLRGETKDFDSALESLKSKISEHEGYVEKSSVTGGESLNSNRKSSRNAVYTIRIPAEKLDDFLEKTEGMLNIISSSESTTDVTLEYYDIESRMKTLEAKKAALEKMLEQATSLSDIRTIQDDLYEVIADIEAYRSKLNLFDSKVSYSTVELTIIEVVEYTEVKEEEPSFGERISETFKESWQGFWEFCQDFAVFLVGAMPAILVLLLNGVAVFLIVFFVKRKNKRRAQQIKNNENMLK
ncbi:MAG: DUF4349 domain-containing protein [Clostridia bacterium]|nr:DUF4349 domain-containing protein [Clostridia bacterium]